MIWVAISWYSAGPIITLIGRISDSDHVDILGNQVHSLVQMLFPNNEGVIHDDNSPVHTHPEVFNLGLRSMKTPFNIFSGQQNRQT